MGVGVLCLCACFYGCIVREHSQKSDPDCSKPVGSVSRGEKLFSARCGKTNVNLRRCLKEIMLYKYFND